MFDRFVKRASNNYAKIAVDMKNHDRMESHKIAVGAIENLKNEVYKRENILIGKIDTSGSIENTKIKKSCTES